MSDALRQQIRRSGILPALDPPEAIRQRQAVGQVIDPTGTIIRDALRPYLPTTRYPLHLHGTLTAGAGTTQDCTERAGTLTRLRAAVLTAPAGSSCVVELRDGAGTALATVTIPAGQTTGESAGLAVPLNAGTWLVGVVMQAGGAAELSLIASQQIG